MIDKSKYCTVLALFFASIQHVLTTICPVPPPCKCSPFGGARAYCQNLNLTEVPTLIKSGGTWILDLSNNNIKSIRAGTFAAIQLEQLYLSNNSITHIDDDAFNGSEVTMDVLRLDGNQLKTLPPVLTRLKNLIGTTVQYNPMSDLDIGILSNMSNSFASISFGSKNMTSWPTSLQSLENLLMLSIYDLPLQTFPENAFLGFENTLGYLEVISTEFENIPVSMNRLTNLNFVSIKNNRNLKILPEISFKGLMNITTLIIQDNGFTNMAAVFKDANKMYQVTISSKKITEITEAIYAAKFQSRFPYLTITNTMLNKIPKAISNMATVTVISLQNGNISSLSHTDLKNLPSLANIVLSNNPLTTVDKHALKNLPSLRYLSLDGTKLTTVPEAVSNAPLTWINLNGTSVTCTCTNLKWMKSWPLRLNTTIEGNCVNIGKTIEQYKNDIIKICL